MSSPKSNSLTSSRTTKEDTNARDEGGTAAIKKVQSVIMSMNHSTILKVTVLFGFGMIVGCGIFYSIFQYQCVYVMDELVQCHNATVTTLHEKYVKAMDDHTQCREDDTKIKEINELRGRLESQSDLVTSYRTLLQKHKATADRLVELEKEVEQKEDEMTNEIRMLKSSIYAFQSSKQEMIDHVQQRHSVMCRQFFGKGPYYVKFTLQLPNQQQQDQNVDNPLFFVIEISTRKQLPHSVFTFLTLVESGFYNDDFKIVSSSKVSMVIGSNTFMKNENGKSITVWHYKLKKLGLSGGSALSFLEESIQQQQQQSDDEDSSTICEANSFGFNERGPTLRLHLSARDDLSFGSDCFGRVVRGNDILSTLPTSTRIVSVDLLGFADGFG